MNMYACMCVCYARSLSEDLPPTVDLKASNMKRKWQRLLFPSWRLAQGWRNTGYSIMPSGRG